MAVRARVDRAWLSCPALQRAPHVRIYGSQLRSLRYDDWRLPSSPAASHRPHSQGGRAPIAGNLEASRLNLDSIPESRGLFAMETAMSALKSDGHGAERFSALTASAIASAAGGAMDAWVYMVHGVFATAQSGNVVLASIALAGGDLKLAATHLPSLLAFIVGLLISRWCAQLIKRRHRNSRNIRLGVECLMLVALGLVAARLPDHIVTACIAPGSLQRSRSQACRTSAPGPSAPA